MAQLYPHQQQAYDRASGLATKSMLIEQACGTGKSRVIAALAGNDSALPVVIVPSLVLSAQVARQFEALAVGAVLKIDSDADGTTDARAIASQLPGRRVVICTYHSIGTLRAALAEAGRPFRVLFDECHHAVEEHCREHCKALHDSAQRAFYFSATPGDNQRELCDDHYRYLPSQGVDDEVLKSFNLIVKLASVDYSRGDLGPEGRCRGVLKGVIHEALRGDSRRALVRCGLANVGMGDGRMVSARFAAVDASALLAQIRQRFPELRRRREGLRIRVDVVTGDTPRAEREAVLRDFDGEADDVLHVLVFTNVLAEGVDTKSADLLVVADASLQAASWRRAVQLFGRVMRLRQWGTPEAPSKILLMGYLDKDAYAPLTADESRRRLTSDVGRQVALGPLAALKQTDPVYYERLLLAAQDGHRASGAGAEGVGEAGEAGGDGVRRTGGDGGRRTGVRPRLAVDASLVELDFAEAPDLDSVVASAVVRIRLTEDARETLKAKWERIAQHVRDNRALPKRPKPGEDKARMRLYDAWSDYLYRGTGRDEADDACAGCPALRQLLDDEKASRAETLAARAETLESKWARIAQHVRDNTALPKQREDNALYGAWSEFVHEGSGRAEAEAACVACPALQPLLDEAKASRAAAAVSVKTKWARIAQHVRDKSALPKHDDDMTLYRVWSSFVRRGADRVDADAEAACDACPALRKLLDDAKASRLEIKWARIAQHVRDKAALPKVGEDSQLHTTWSTYLRNKSMPRQAAWAQAEADAACAACPALRQLLDEVEASRASRASESRASETLKAKWARIAQHVRDNRALPNRSEDIALYNVYRSYLYKGAGRVEAEAAYAACPALRQLLDEAKAATLEA